MKIILSPAKNINELAFRMDESTFPVFEKEANFLVKDLKKMKKPDLQRLLGISIDLAEQNPNITINFYERCEKLDRKSN